ncbi:winged helix-turn-helix domain-containing protein [Saccharothrix sp. NRRL B-16348]|uniref:winged helix-turn-helix domain-containing protein n=1 Tax=Saccharothrix sp. NRRL B-16348 TaxID=1415542 RepID=UPI0012F8C1EA
MVVACPSGAGPNASRSGYRRRSGSPRTWPWRRSPADCGCRPTDLIARLFHTHYTLREVSYLLHCMGFSPQVPTAAGPGVFLDAGPHRVVGAHAVSASWGSRGTSTGGGARRGDRQSRAASPPT